jgi:hypothetical protein
MRRVLSLPRSRESTSKSNGSQRQINAQTQTEFTQPTKIKSRVDQFDATFTPDRVQWGLEFLHGQLLKRSHELSLKTKSKTSPINVGRVNQNKELYGKLSETLETID